MKATRRTSSEALQPIMERYSFIIIDCPPSLGVVTKNGLRLSTHYLIPHHPGYRSTWGNFQIVTALPHLRKYQPHNTTARNCRHQGERAQPLHAQVIQTLRNGQLFNAKKTTLTQPPLFQIIFQEATATSRGADSNRT